VRRQRIVSVRISFGLEMMRVINIVDGCLVVLMVVCKRLLLQRSFEQVEWPRCLLLRLKLERHLLRQSVPQLLPLPAPNTSLQ
jgi:hypothetical protein